MAKKTTLSKKVKKAVRSYVKILKEDNLPIKEVIVFGSHAKKNTHKGSDIDVCIVSSKFKDYFEALHYLLLKSYKIKGLIEPHPFHPKDFVDEDPLVWEIKKYGIKIDK